MLFLLFFASTKLGPNGSDARIPPDTHTHETTFRSSPGWLRMCCHIPRRFAVCARDIALCGWERIWVRHAQNSRMIYVPIALLARVVCGGIMDGMKLFNRLPGRGGPPACDLAPQKQQQPFGFGGLHLRRLCSRL